MQLPEQRGTLAERTRHSVVILSSSLLVDRMLLHTQFLDTVRDEESVEVWATSASNPHFADMWRSRPVALERFPAVRPFRESWHNVPRRFHEAVWDCQRREPSRMSMRQHRPPPTRPVLPRALHRVASSVASHAVERALDRVVEPWLLAYDRSPEAAARLRASRPEVILSTGPFQFEQPAIIAAAKRLRIPTLALIPSWDNVSTKRRMLFTYDGYLVWSEQTRRELCDRYPATREQPIYVIGAPQFDVFFQPRFQQSREEYCAQQGVDASRPIIVYAIGSPNFLAGEPHGARQLAETVERGELGNAQLLVRPHPLHDNAELDALFSGFGPAVRVQRTATPGTPLAERSQDERQIAAWVNTFRHADVVVNLASTVTVDAAICDRPIVNLDFDPTPGAPDQQLVHDINHLWTHFKPVAESGGVALAHDASEVVAAIRRYLAHPELDREGRQWIARHVCEYLDGRSGERMGEAVLDFLSHIRASEAHA